MIFSGIKKFNNIVFNSKDSKTILLHSDHKRRDAPAFFLLAYYLRELGYNVVIGSRMTTYSLWEILKPELLLLNFPNVLGGSDVLGRIAESTTVVILHPESSAMMKGGILPHFRGGNDVQPDEYLKYISYIFTWGPQLKDWLVEDGLFPGELIEVIGCNRYDFYLNSSSCSEAKKVSAMSSFTGISSFDNRNVFLAIHQARISEGTHFAKGRGYEDYLWAAAAYVRIFLEFLDVWCLELKNPIHFRSYTLENPDDFSFFRERYKPYLIYDIHSPFPKWLKGSKGNVFCYSSSIIESIISGVPYITVQNILGEALEYHQPRSIIKDTRGAIYDFVYQPGTVEELVELLQKAEDNKLDLKVKPNESSELRDMLWRYYGWPQKLPTSYQLANRLSDLVEEKSVMSASKRKRNWRKALRHMSSLFRQISKVDFYNNPLGATNEDYHLMPWHTLEREYAWQEFIELKKLTDKNQKVLAPK